MTATPDTPAATPGEGVETTRADLVCAGRVTSAAEYLAGYLAAGELKSAATPHALVQDTWPEVDPAVVQEIFNRGCATGWMGRGLYAAPVLHGDELAALQARLEEAGFHAMGGMVAGSRRLVAPEVPVHPADSEAERGR